jgi:hypothetical protein
MGIEEHSTLNTSSQTFEVYPNPAKAFFVVRCPSSVNNQVLKMFDVSGKLVKEIASATPRNDKTAEMRVSLKGMSPGIYFVQAGRETKKLIVTK